MCASIFDSLTAQIDLHLIENELEKREREKMDRIQFSNEYNFVELLPFRHTHTLTVARRWTIQFSVLPHRPLHMGHCPTGGELAFRKETKKNTKFQFRVIRKLHVINAKQLSSPVHLHTATESELCVWKDKFITK